MIEENRRKFRTRAPFAAPADAYVHTQMNAHEHGLLLLPPPLPACLPGCLSVPLSLRLCLYVFVLSLTPLLPSWPFSMPATTTLRHEHEQYQINATVVSDGGMRVDSVPSEREAMTSGSYRQGFCYCEGVLSAGTYTIIISTFKPGQVHILFFYLLVLDNTLTAYISPACEKVFPQGGADCCRHAI